MSEVLLMPCRLNQLRASLDGLYQTGVPLVAAQNGTFAPAGAGDDPGLYFIVPVLARLTGLPVQQAATLFLYGLLLVAVIIGATGCFSCWDGYFRRFLGVGAIAVAAWFALRVADVYIIPITAVVAAAPWLAAIVLGPISDVRRQSVIVGLTGLGAGLANTVRSQSGTIVLLLATGLLLANPGIRLRQRLVVFTVLIGGVLVALGATGVALDVRDSYLSNHVSNYAVVARQHPFWHSVYIGLGYINNSHGIRYLDEVAIARVHDLAPTAGYLSREYEATLMGEVFRIARADPYFIVRDLLSKIGHLAYVFLVLVNVALIAAVRHRKPVFVDGSFGLALLFAAAPGILVIPIPQYVSGFIALSLMWAAISVNFSPWPDTVPAWAVSQWQRIRRPAT